MHRRRRIAPLLAVILIAGLTFSGAVLASDAVAPPKAGQIEQLLRQALKSGEISRLPSMLSYDDATLLEFSLEDMKRISPKRVDALVDMTLDFGPPPPGVLRYERQRRGRYELELHHGGDGWELQRVTPLADLRRMPG